MLQFKRWKERQKEQNNRKNEKNFTEKEHSNCYVYRVWCIMQIWHAHEQMTQWTGVKIEIECVFIVSTSYWTSEWLYISFIEILEINKARQTGRCEQKDLIILVIGQANKKKRACKSLHSFRSETTFQEFNIYERTQPKINSFKS